MPSLNDPNTESAKVLLIGDSGHGKTGAKASLIAAGYKLRMIDTDRGFKILRSLLTDSHYPYAAYMKHHGIDPYEPGRISYIPIETPIDVQTVTVSKSGRNISYDILAPTSVAAWRTVLNQLREWKDEDQNLNLGPITDWGPDEVLDFDSISTLAKMAKYWMQSLNGHMGALEDDHGRDSGGAQELIDRLSDKVTSSKVKCNVILTTHITKIDVERGAPMTPQELLREKKAVDPRGFPSIIGKALSPLIGRRWNDTLIMRRTGNSGNAEWRIHAEPVDNTDAKHSVWLEPSYPISTGLAEIFAALQFKELPEDFISSIRGKEPERGQPSEQRISGFGSR